VSILFKKNIQSFNLYLLSYNYLFKLKKKVTNKTYVEISICNAYIVEEILIFILCYFEPYMRTKINHVLRYNDDGGVILNENLSIFPYPG
jgi:hypothetical protein